MLNPQEREFIMRTAEILTIPEIGRQLKRDENTVRSFCKRKGLKYINGHPGKKSQEIIKFERPSTIKRRPADYDNHRPSKYGVAYLLHHTKMAI